MLARPLFFCIALLVAFSPMTHAADNVFLPPGGGDLLDPANWSNGVVPTPPANSGIINEGNHQDFTVGSDNSSIEIAWLGNGIDAYFDLQGRSVRADLFTGITQPHTENWKFSNGVFLYESRLLGISNNPTTFKLEFSNFTWNGRIQSNPESGIVVVDAGSLINNLSLTGETQSVEVRGHSSVVASSNYYEAIRLDCTESVSLIVDEGSSLGPGSYHLNTGVNTGDPAELRIRGGSTTSNIDLRISPLSTILIEGSNTNADFKTLYIVTGGLSDFTSYLQNPLSTTTIKDKAVVSVHGPPPEITGPHFGPDYSFILGKLNVEGEGTRFELSGPGSGQTIELNVINGAQIHSEQTIDVLSKAVIDHSVIYTSIKSYLGYPGSSIPASLTIDHGEVHGNISDFKLLEFNQGLVQGDVSAAKVVGNGLIDGNIVHTELVRDIEIHPDEHLEITGDLAISGLYFDVFSRDHFDTIDVGGSLQGKINWDLIDPYQISSPLPKVYFEIANHITFDDGFFASVGDRFVLLHYTGGSIEFDALHRFNPSIIAEESFQRDLLNLTIDNLPDGYQIDVFLENGDMGFTIVAVPEVSTTMLVGMGLLSLIVCHRYRRRFANAPVNSSPQ